MILTTFRDLGVLPETADALADLGITHPFPIQETAIPVALGGNDIIGQAKTGTGKTLGFGIPLLQRIDAPADATQGDGRPQALVVVPTRELCVQVSGDLEAAGRTRKVRVLSVYGGRSYDPQLDALKQGVDVVVGTPGRLLDLARQRHLDLSKVRVLVLDEADEMLDLGFLPDVERIVGLTPANRQTMLFSATMRGPVIGLARRYMRQPTHIRAGDPDDSGATVAAVTQHVFRAHSLDKIEMLARLLQAGDRGLTIVFCQTKRAAARVADDLSDRGFAAAAVHGDLGQGAREQALRAFRNGKVDVLVATEVAARGIDVEGVTHVVNYECPDDEKTYLHRIGRTARAGASGIAVTLVDWDDLHRWTMINKALELPFAEPPETYSTSEHFLTAMNVPEGASGVLPRANRTRAGLDAEEVEDIGETGKRARSGIGARRGSRSGEGRGKAERRQDSDESGTRPARRRTKQRRRTRGGEPVSGAEGAAAGGAADAPAAPAATAAEPNTGPAEPGGTGEGAEAGRIRRRRRRRRGEGQSQSRPAAE
jgi:superfamily II DNA/RNA helicase